MAEKMIRFADQHRSMRKVKSFGQMEERDAPEDLRNRAARETLAHAGDVFIVPPEKVPGGGQIATVLRY